MFIPIRLIVELFKRITGRAGFCRHHHPWQPCCKLDRQGIRWKCCECEKERNMLQ